MIQATPRQTSDLSPFDYAELDVENRKVLQQHANEIKARLVDAAQSIWEIGRMLADARDRLRSKKYGQFGAWLKHEFPPKFSRSKAYSYIKVYEYFPTCPESGQVEIADSALILWASSVMPEAARQELSAMAEAGERITYSIAEDARLRYTPSASIEELEEGYSPAITLGQEELQEDRLQGERSHQVLPDQTSFAQATHSITSLKEDDVQVSSGSQTGVPTTRPYSKRKRAKQEEKSKVIYPRKVRPGEWWKLGKEDYLYCGDPLSEKFQRHLPETISFSLAFSPSDRWHLDYLSSKLSKAHSRMVLQTVFDKEQDLTLLRVGIEKFFEVYTEGREVVVLSFMPDPAILPLIEQLDCRFFVADPDPKRCDAAIRVWTTTMKQPVEKMNSRQVTKKLLSS